MMEAQTAMLQLKPRSAKDSLHSKDIPVSFKLPEAEKDKKGFFCKGFFSVVLMAA